MYSLPYVDMTFVAGLPHSTFSIRYQLSKCHVSSIFLDYCGRRFANEGLAIDYSSNAVSAYTINNKLAWPFYDDTVLWKAFEAASQIAGEAEELTNEGL